MDEGKKRFTRAPVVFEVSVTAVLECIGSTGERHTMQEYSRMLMDWKELLF